MSNIMRNIDTDNFIQLYKSGFSLAKLSRQFRTGHDHAVRLLHAHGIEIRHKATWRSLDAQSVIALYNSGVSENAIAQSLDVGRPTIRSLLVANGIHIRNMSEADSLRWSKMTAYERDLQTAAAHKSTKGRKATLAEREKRARTVFSLGNRSTLVEMILIEWLAERDVKAFGQFPVGMYNIDVAIQEPSIAVEIFGGGWHSSGRHASRFLERTKYLLDHGWSVVIIWVDTRHHPLLITVCDQIITLLDELSGGITKPRQYRVLWGDGKTPPATSNNFNDISTIEALGCRS